LYDIDRRLRPVGVAYKALIEEFAGAPVVPNGSFLTLM